MRKAALQKVEQACKQPDKDAERYSLFIYFFYFSMWVILSFTFFLDHRHTQNHIWLRSRVFSLGSPHSRPRDSLYKRLVLPLTCSFGFRIKSSCSTMAACSCVSRHSWHETLLSYVVRCMNNKGNKISAWREGFWVLIVCWYRVAYCIMILWDIYNRSR